MRLALALACVSAVVVSGCGSDRFVTGDAGDGGTAEGSAQDGGKARTIACKGVRDCLTLTESCCLILNQTDDQCIPKPAMASTECPNMQSTLLVMCDDATDCPGTGACCATRQNSAFSSACVPQAQCGGGDRLLMCDPAQDQCPSGSTCKPHPQIPRYNACQ